MKCEKHCNDKGKSTTTGKDNTSDNNNDREMTTTATMKMTEDKLEYLLVYWKTRWGTVWSASINHSERKVWSRPPTWSLSCGSFIFLPMAAVP